MNYLKQTIILILCMACFACSKDDSNENSNSFSASDLIATIDEHSGNGTQIGTIATNISGNLSYTIISQSVEGALRIDGSTGLVRVNDRLKLDFETTSLFEATVEVTNSVNTATATISLTLNNVDDIATFLWSSSREAYNAAEPGDWIKISETEYNNLAEALNDVVKSGSTDEQYDFDDTISPVGASINGITMVNNNDVSMPINSYVFAFKYNVTEDNIEGAKVKTILSSCCPMTDNKNLGTELPMHNSGDNYFVLKGNDLPTTHAGSVGFFCPKKPGFKRLSYDTNYLFNQSDALYFTDQGATARVLILYQGLSTIEKQWD